MTHVAFYGLYTGYKPDRPRGVTEHSDMECRGNLFLTRRNSFCHIFVSSSHIFITEARHPINAAYLRSIPMSASFLLLFPSLLAAIGAATAMFSYRIGLDHEPCLPPSLSRRQPNSLPRY
jgi:hypothetical protein